jgi:hypothetical protein
MVVDQKHMLPFTNVQGHDMQLEKCIFVARMATTH